MEMYKLISMENSASGIKQGDQQNVTYGETYFSVKIVAIKALITI
jgi:hypothetical protein